MNRYIRKLSHIALWAIVGIAIPASFALPVQAQTESDDSPTTAAVREDIEVLSRGPVHEAFAEPVIFDPQPGRMIRQQPPQPVEELPPDQKPEGEDVVWIPGYWAWDDDHEGFIWVSGFWRVVPPGRNWVPGYWATVSEGYQWVSGFWANAETGHVEYLPTPPESLETGPNMPAPSAEHFWAPGAWQYYQDRYVWRPGCWTASHRNWVWVPTYYVWTPRGCVHVPGYWDYGIARRGLLYAPVRLRPHYYSGNGYHYSPRHVVDVSLLIHHFFVRPNCRHYYYGDYHSPHYAQHGFYPWFAFHSHRRCYDPIYAHHHHHHDRDWDHRLREEYRERREHAEHSRSPHPRDDHRERGDHREREDHPDRDDRREHGEHRERAGSVVDHEKRGGSERFSHSLVKSLDRLVPHEDSDLRLEKLIDSERDQVKKAAQETRQLARHRSDLENHSARNRDEATSGTLRNLETPRLELPKSPDLQIQNPKRERPPVSVLKPNSVRLPSPRGEKVESKIAPERSDERPILEPQRSVDERRVREFDRTPGGRSPSAQPQPREPSPENERAKRALRDSQEPAAGNLLDSLRNARDAVPRPGRTDQANPPSSGTGEARRDSEPASPPRNSERERGTNASERRIESAPTPRLVPNVARPERGEREQPPAVLRSPASTGRGNPPAPRMEQRSGPSVTPSSERLRSPRPEIRSAPSRPRPSQPEPKATRRSRSNRDD